MAEEKEAKPRVAVALGYKAGEDQAPRILAAGRGDVAEALIRIARQHHIPLHQDHPLAGALVKLELGTAIPQELYAAVAEVLAFLWRLEQARSAHGWGEERTR